MFKYTPEKQIEAFWKKVAISSENECWLWTRSTMGRGYGKVWFKNKIEGSHRVAWQIMNGEIPNGLWVLHSCDNPLCCNPRHLFLGTQKDNTDDMYSKGREARGEKVSNPGERNPAHKLTEDQVKYIRQRFALGGISKRKLASEVGISPSQLGLIIQRKSWKNIE